MLKILRYVFSVVGILFAVYGLITKNLEFQPYMMLFLGLMMLVMGLEEFQKERKAYGWLFFVVFLLSLFVSIKGFLLK
ncbi:DUF3953 domain-containing protein [Aquibacillus sp. 3ASR75-11]|uniref:DUF3953 domain-containing protein n=1 Tax=Terrihalobacillus insolitus TaxID=2950438 RepID=A0A9X3WWA2_9BACI|nr:DUF3953 domain-containing protein [Terrihalobacillus insolitus]MDC3424504.1 DUF3953 domain-containing protein [Terrihalobacillus insolitus]